MVQADNTVQAKRYDRSGLVYCKWNITLYIYKAVMRLRKSACELPPSAKAISSVMDLTASSKQDIVPISIIPDAPVRELSCNHSKAASTRYVMEINTGDITIRVSNDVTNSLLSHTLKILGGMS